MKAGAFARAWRVSDQLQRAGGPRNVSQLPLRDRPVWRGEPLADRIVLVRCHHGLGDTIQFIRYVARLTPIARAVHVKAQAPLLPLLARSLDVDGLWGLEEEDPEHDAAIEVMELPYAFRTTRRTIPRAVPYLDADPRARAMARTALARVDGCRVGLVWAVGPYWRPERSLPLSIAAALGDIAGVSLVSLQRGPAVDEAAALPGLFAWTTASDAIDDTAALLSELDLLIGVDTMVVHLAGALAIPTWTLLGRDPDWRWMATGTRSPWYPTMRLFRQAASDDWSTLIAHVARALTIWHGESAGRARRRSPCGRLPRTA